MKPTEALARRIIEGVEDAGRMITRAAARRSSHLR